jgi:hypothetical protein
MGSRADQTHLAFQYVDDLRQFVERSFAQELAEAGNACIAARCLFYVSAIFADVIERTVDLDFFAVQP